MSSYHHIALHQCIPKVSKLLICLVCNSVLYARVYVTWRYAVDRGTEFISVFIWKNAAGWQGCVHLSTTTIFWTGSYVKLTLETMMITHTHTYINGVLGNIKKMKELTCQRKDGEQEHSVDSHLLFASPHKVTTFLNNPLKTEGGAVNQNCNGSLCVIRGYSESLFLSSLLLLSSFVSAALLEQRDAQKARPRQKLFCRCISSSSLLDSVY